MLSLTPSNHSLPSAAPRLAPPNPTPHQAVSPHGDIEAIAGHNGSGGCTICTASSRVLKITAKCMSPSSCQGGHSAVSLCSIHALGSDPKASPTNACRQEYEIKGNMEDGCNDHQDEPQTIAAPHTTGRQRRAYLLDASCRQRMFG